MSNARDNILGKLLQAVSTNSPPVEQAHDDTNLDSWEVEKRIEKFSERMSGVRAEVIETGPNQWLQTLLELSQAKQLRNLLIDPSSTWSKALLETAKKSESWPDELLPYEKPIDEWKQELFADAALTSTRGGIAETRSLIPWPTASEPRMMSLVPPVHIAILLASKLCTSFAEVVEQQQQWGRKCPLMRC